MKHLYVILISCLSLAIPEIAFSQCSCTGGRVPDSIIHNYTLAVNSSPNITITFPKFDPALGTLSCYVYKDTLSAVSTTRVRNNDVADQEYSFRLTVNNQITGPGISVNAYMDKYYGPDSLKGFNQGIDSITYGPDTTFDRVTHSVVKTSNLSPFMGTGNVNFNYGISGGLISMAGGLNFTQEIESARWGSFRLAYYYCPNAILGSNIKNLSLNKKEKGVNITWTSSNQSNTYEIEISTDGKNFSSAGKAKQTSIAGSTSTKYEYQYNPDQDVAGTVYFRIKETDPEGKVKYTETKMVNLDKSSLTTNLYPNPAATGVNVTLDRFIVGDVEVSLMNLVGQALFTKTYKLDKLNTIHVQWPTPVKPGMYYLKVRDIQAQTESISKVFVK